jgi:hypothetical protein
MWSDSKCSHLFAFIQKMLCLDPVRRITARSALGHEYFKDLGLVPWASDICLCLYYILLWHPTVKACILLGHETKWCWFLSFSCFYFVWHEILSYPTRSWMKDWFLTEGNGWLPECLWASHSSWCRQAENLWEWSASQTCVVNVGCHVLVHWDFFLSICFHSNHIPPSI